MALNRDPAQQAELSSLPTEILRQCFETLTRKDLKSLRLMSSKISIIASERLFESILVNNEAPSYLQLTNITASPRWSRQEQNICWSAPEVSGPIRRSQAKLFYNNLLDQSKFVRKLPNVKDVYFATRPELVLYESLKSYGEDLYNIIRDFNLQPAIVRTEDIKLQFEYSSGSIRTVIVEPASSAVLNDGGSNSLLDALCRSKHPKRLGYHGGLYLFQSLAESEAASLQSFSVSALPVNIDFFRTLLSQAMHITRLNLTDVTLDGSSDDHHVADLLFMICRRKINNVAPLNVALTRIHQAFYHGCFSTSDAEITK